MNLRTHIAAMVWAALLACVLLSLSGCITGGKGQPASPRPDSASVAGRHEAKDATVTTEADKIDATVKGTAQAADVKASTDAQRAAVAAAPARDIVELAATFNRLLDERDRRITRLEAELKAAREAALREQVRWLNGAGVLLLVGFGVSVGFGGLPAAAKSWPLVPLAAGAFGLAQVVGSPWFLRGFLALLVVGAAYGVWWAIQKHRDGRLRAALEKKSAKLQGVLGEIVPVLDQAYEKAGESVRDLLDKSIFDRLGDAFTREQKAAIHEIRAEAKATR